MPRSTPPSTGFPESIALSFVKRGLEPPDNRWGSIDRHGYERADQRIIQADRRYSPDPTSAN